MDAKSRAIIVVKHYLHGDFANALGIANVLAERFGSDIQIVDAHLRTTLTDPLLRLIVNYRKSNGSEPSPKLGEKLWPVLFKGKLPTGITPSTLIISTLGRGEPVSAFLASFWRASAIHLGPPKRMPRSAFAAVICHPGVAPNPGEIELPISPTKIRLRKNASKTHDAKKVAVLVGGNADPIRYGNGSWARFAKYLQHVSRETHIELHASTSPRTGLATENELLSQLDLHQVPIRSFVKYGAGDHTPVKDILDGASAAIVTADSVSMISDAVALGIPVIAVHDDNIAVSDRVRSFVEQLATSKLISVVNLREQNGTERSQLDALDITPLTECWSQHLWRELSHRRIV